MSDDDKNTKIAWAIYQALKSANELAAVDEPDSYESVIDGTFNLAKVALKLEEELQAVGLRIEAGATEA